MFVNILTLAALFSALKGAAAAPFVGGKKQDVCGDAFAKIIEYRPWTMARYVARTTAWNEGRRDILDWGCGGGGLAHALASKGARKVVAVDMNALAINSTKHRLEPFPNAAARGPRRQLFGPPGQLGYSRQFDIVVSSCGALSDETTMVPRIQASNAMKQAIQACRDGGSVIVGEFVESFRHHTSLAAMLLACVFGWKCEASWLWDRPEWFQYAAWYLICLPILGNPPKIQMVVMLKNICRSFMLRQWRTSSILFGTWLLLGILRSVWSGHVYIQGRKKAMAEAGLGNVKHSSYFLPLVVQPVHGKEASSQAKIAAWTANANLFPKARMFVFEGVKKGEGYD